MWNDKIDGKHHAPSLCFAKAYSAYLVWEKQAEEEEVEAETKEEDEYYSVKDEKTERERRERRDCVADAPRAQRLLMRFSFLSSIITKVAMEWGTE